MHDAAYVRRLQGSVDADVASSESSRRVFLARITISGDREGREDGGGAGPATRFIYQVSYIIYRVRIPIMTPRTALHSIALHCIAFRLSVRLVSSRADASLSTLGPMAIEA